MPIAASSAAAPAKLPRIAVQRLAEMVPVVVVKLGPEGALAQRGKLIRTTNTTGTLINGLQSSPTAAPPPASSTLALTSLVVSLIPGVYLFRLASGLVQLADGTNVVHKQVCEIGRIHRDQRIGDAVRIVQRDRTFETGIKPFDRLGRQRMRQCLVDYVTAGSSVEGLNAQHGDP